MTRIKFLVSSLSLFLSLPVFVFANNINHIIISEVQIEGDTTTDEFIELYNPTNADINLTNWRISKKTSSGNQTNILTAFPNNTIKAEGYFLIAHADYKGENAPDVLFSISSASLAKDNTILLYSDNGKTLIDKLGFGAAQDKENNPAPNPGKKESLERHFNTDTDNNLSDFFIQAVPNPKNANSIKSNNNLPLLNSPTNNTQLPVTPAIEPKLGDVVINEFLPNTIYNQKEWIELYNTTNNRIGLSNHFIEESSGKKIELYDFLEPSGPNKFFTLEIDSGYLNNDGDIILLKNKNGTIIDKVSYGDFNDNNINDNAEAPPKDISVAREHDGANTNNNARDFKLTFSKTKNMANIIYTERNRAPSDTNTAHISTLKGKIIINEVLPNPFGNDKNNEFVELKNLTHEEIDLNLWQITTNTGKYIINRKDFSDTKIKPWDFFTLPSNITNLSLSNSKDHVKLWEGKEMSVLLMDTLNYEISAKNNLSYNKIGEYNFAWTIPTPGAQNALIIPNEAPKAIIADIPQSITGDEIIFDASASMDPEGDDLEYFWNFGDGHTSQSKKTSHRYRQAGNYKAMLTVLDITGAADKKEFIIAITDNEIVSTKQEELKQYTEQQHSPQILKTKILNDKLTQISGRVMRTRGRNVYVNTDGSETRAYFQEAIFPNYPKLYKGDLVTITGIKDKIKNGYRILPQRELDIKINRVQASGSKNNQDDILYNDILGAEIKLDESANDQSETNNVNYKYYFYITLFSLIIVLSFVWYQKIQYKNLQDKN